MTAYYGITTVAREADLTRQTIYMWLAKGWILPSAMLDDRIPIFTEKNIKAVIALKRKRKPLED